MQLSGQLNFGYINNLEFESADNCPGRWRLTFRILLTITRSTLAFLAHASWLPARVTSARSKLTTSFSVNTRIDIDAPYWAHGQGPEFIILNSAGPANNVFCIYLL
jgi:hypothetical protein